MAENGCYVTYGPGVMLHTLLRSITIGDDQGACMTTDETQGPETKIQTKKPYVEPRLVEYGSISKLTQNNVTGSFADAGSMRMMTSCL